MRRVVDCREQALLLRTADLDEPVAVTNLDRAENPTEVAALITLGLEMWLALARAETEVLNRAAMALRVSPLRTE